MTEHRNIRKRCARKELFTGEAAVADLLRAAARGDVRCDLEVRGDHARLRATWEDPTQAEIEAVRRDAEATGGEVVVREVASPGGGHHRWVIGARWSLAPSAPSRREVGGVLAVLAGIAGTAAIALLGWAMQVNNEKQTK